MYLFTYIYIYIDVFVYVYTYLYACGKIELKMIAWENSIPGRVTILEPPSWTMGMSSESLLVPGSSSHSVGQSAQGSYVII